MATNLVTDHLDSKESRYKQDSAADKLEQNRNNQPFDSGHIWMDLAGKGKLNEKKSADNCSSCLPGLPDLDLHSSKDDDHGGKNRVAEELLDDIDTVLRANANGKVSISKERETKLSRIKNDGDLPLIKCPEMSPGQLGILMSKNADGHTYYTPFIAAAADKQVQGHASSSINVNERAAKELHIDGAFKKGAVPKVDIIALPQEPPSPTSPRSTGELNQVVMDKFHNMSIEIRDKQAADRAAAEADLPEPPAPDPEFGYKRTDRSTEELRKIADNYTNLARESLKATAPEGVEDRMKEFGKQAQADIDKYQGEINHNKTDKRHLQEQEETLLHQKAKLAPDSQAALNLQERLDALDKSAKESDSSLQTSQYNLSYAQSELNISKHQDAYLRHMRARASAAAMLAVNPDMDGALSGHHIAINSGHYPGDPKFPGFSKDGIPEQKINMECEDVVGAMIKMAGGAVKLVNQEDLKDKSMTGLTNALKAAKPEAAIAIHHDDSAKPDDPAMRGTLTLQCAKTTGAGSLEFAKAIHMAKLNYAGLDDKVNSKGDSIGIREQCGRGIQGHNIGAPFILDEELSTHKDEWPLMRDPKTNAEIQFAHVAGLYEFLENKPRFKTSPAEAKLYRDQIWSKSGLDDVFANRPKVGSW